MDNFGFEGDSDDEEEQSGNDNDSEEERHCQPDMERVLINPYR